MKSDYADSKNDVFVLGLSLFSDYRFKCDWGRTRRNRAGVWSRGGARVMHWGKVSRSFVGGCSRSLKWCLKYVFKRRRVVIYVMKKRWSSVWARAYTSCNEMARWFRRGGRIAIRKLWNAERRFIIVFIKKVIVIRISISISRVLFFELIKPAQF